MNDTFDIYCFAEKRSNRLTYILREIVENRFGATLKLLQSVDEFNSANGIKINYSSLDLPNSVQIYPSSFLFQKRISEIEFEIQEAGMPLLFADSKSDIGFDLLSACFYFLSLYQEYLPYRGDEHGRFTSAQSIQGKYNAHQKALVDEYIELLASSLKKKFPEFTPRKTQLKIEVTIDVDQLYLYKAKGMARTALSLGRDAILNQNQFVNRSQSAILGLKDPLDIYDQILEQCQNRSVRPTFFIQVGETSQFDHNNPVHLPAISQKINVLALNADIGLHPSYFSSDSPQRLEQEVNRLKNVSSSAIVSSRQHYMRWRLPNTMVQLSELGIQHDYTLGFTDSNGFRAGTSHPFHFFDLQRDEVLDIVLHPTHFSDMVAIRGNKTLESAEAEMKKLESEVSKYEGTFCTMWHPECLIGKDVDYASMPLLNTMLG